MSSWLHRQSNSHCAQLAGTAVLSGAAVAGVILGYQSIRRKSAVKRLKESLPNIDDDSALQVSTHVYPFQ